MQSEEKLKEFAMSTLCSVTTLINRATLEGKTNEQWFLNWLDLLNKYSIMF